MNLSYSQNIIFKDKKFEKAIFKIKPKIDLNNDNIVQISEAEKVIKLDLLGNKISNAEDIKYFINAKYISLTDNKLKSFNISGFKKLEELYCAKNKLTELNISDLPELKRLAFGSNKLRNVHLKNIPKLESLNLWGNKLSTLNLTGFPKLKYLSVNSNEFVELIIKQNPELIQFIAFENNLKEIDVTTNKKLKLGICYYDDGVSIISNGEKMKNLKKGEFMKIK
ncbi:hypothetical protein N9K49_06520 [Flavobacteriaceae bacterium]|nr:hypothetical protein [Flavobacteriaceae bacterium]